MYAYELRRNCICITYVYTQCSSGEQYLGTSPAYSFCSFSFAFVFILVVLLHNKDIFCYFRSLLANLGHFQLISTIFTTVLLVEMQPKCSLSLPVLKNRLLEMQSTHPNSFKYPLHLDLEKKGLRRRIYSKSIGAGWWLNKQF